MTIFWFSSPLFPPFNVHMVYDCPQSTSIELWKSWKTFDEDEDVIMSDSRCSTPDLQEVLDSAKNEEERKRVLKYQEKHNV